MRMGKTIPNIKKMFIAKVGGQGDLVGGGEEELSGRDP